MIRISLEILRCCSIILIICCTQNDALQHNSYCLEFKLRIMNEFIWIETRLIGVPLYANISPVHAASTPSKVLTYFSSLLRASATKFLGPLIYSISGPYSSNNDLHIIILWEDFNFDSWSRFLWSIKTLILCPNRMFLKSSRVSTMLCTSCSVVV